MGFFEKMNKADQALGDGCTHHSLFLFGAVPKWL